MEIDLNKIYNEDCLVTLSKVPDNFIDLTVTSPPYNIGIKYDVYNDNVEWKEYYDWTKEWIKELFRTTKEDGRVCINHYLSCGQPNNRHAPLMKINEIAKKVARNILDDWFEKNKHSYDAVEEPLEYVEEGNDFLVFHQNL